MLHAGLGPPACHAKRSLRLLLAYAYVQSKKSSNIMLSGSDVCFKQQDCHSLQALLPNVVTHRELFRLACRKPELICNCNASLQAATSILRNARQVCCSQKWLAVGQPCLWQDSGPSCRQALCPELTYQPPACMPCKPFSPEKGLSRLLRRSGLSDSPSSEVAVESGDEASPSSTVSRLSAGGALRCRAIWRAGQKVGGQWAGRQQAALKLDEATSCKNVALL